jgi:hypothetical protein
MAVCDDQLADTVVGGIGDIHIAGGVDRDTLGTLQLSLNRRAAIALVAGPSGSRNRGDYAGGRVDFADDVIALVGNVEVTRAVEGNVEGIVDRGVDGQLSVAGIRCVAVAGNRGDDARLRIDIPDAVVRAVGNVHVAGSVERNSSGQIQVSRGRRVSVEH